MGVRTRYATRAHAQTRIGADQYTIYREAGGEAGGSEDAYAASLLLNALLELLEMLLDWVPLQALFQVGLGGAGGGAGSIVCRAAPTHFFAVHPQPPHTVV